MKVSNVLDMQGSKITSLGAPASGGDAATKTYVDTADALKAPLASPTFTGTVTLPATGAGALEAVTKAYADALSPSIPGRYKITLRQTLR